MEDLKIYISIDQRLGFPICMNDIARPWGFVRDCLPCHYEVFCSTTQGAKCDNIGERCCNTMWQLYDIQLGFRKVAWRDTHGTFEMFSWSLPKSVPKAIASFAHTLGTKSLSHLWRWLAHEQRQINWHPRTVSLYVFTYKRYGGSTYTSRWPGTTDDTRVS